MEFYVIYSSVPRRAKAPKEPRYTVRKWVGGVPENDPIGKTCTMKDARKLLPPGLDIMMPLRGDDPAIREIWV